jgi:hypothetical protein
MSYGRGAAQLESANIIRNYQRDWIENTRERVGQGEPFAICNGDEFEDVFNAMDIPVIVINYWNSIIQVKGLAPYYSGLLRSRGYEPNQFALGLASTLDSDADKAPWGGLPKPAVILGGSKNDVEMKVLDIWARELGCVFFPLEFGLDAVPELPAYPPPPRWWERMGDHWDEMIDPHRLDLRVEEEKALISYLEITTGKRLSLAKLTEAQRLINEQMEYWGKTRDLIAETVPCPVSLRDQLAVYQAMWHRGTAKARDFIKDYYEEVKLRVDQGVSACQNERLRLMWMAGTPPNWANYCEEKYGAACVASMFSSIPIDCYHRRTIGGDVMRTVAGRHMVLFFETPDWRLKEAKIHQCDAMVELANSGIPVCQIPRDRDDEEVRRILSDFIETRLLR